MYDDATDTSTSYTFDGLRTVLKAELVGILKAVMEPTLPEETERYILTDSLTSLQLLEKMRHTPGALHAHVFKQLILLILHHASICPTLQIHFHKVIAHTGVKGNELADVAAKAACTRPQDAIDVEGLIDLPTSAIVKDADGKPMTDPEISKHIRLLEKERAGHTNEYNKVWNAKNDSGEDLIDKQASLHYLSTTKKREVHDSQSSTLRRVLQCKADTLLTGSMRYIYGFQDDPHCTLCRPHTERRSVSDTAHTLGGCPAPCLRSLHCQRHDNAVTIISKALTDGYKGAVKILTDMVSDKSNRTRDTDSNRTLPPTLFSDDTSPSQAHRKRPDIVMLMAQRAHQQAPRKYTRPRPGANNRVILVEVTYTSSVGLTQRMITKHTKYASVLEALELSGWRPELHVIALGTIGEITSDTVHSLSVLGVRDEALSSVLRLLHNNAITWLDKCVDAEIAANGWETGKAAYPSNKRRKK